MGVVWPYTNRIAYTWTEWERQQYNQPSRTDYYLIQLTYIVGSLIAGLGGSNNYPDMDYYVLDFGDGSSTKDAPSGDINTPEQLANSVVSWMARVGMRPEEIKQQVERILPPEENLRLEDSL